MSDTLAFASMIRRCTTCGQEKPLDAFAKAIKVKRDGRMSQCRKCRKMSMDEYRARPGTIEREAEYHARRYKEPEYRQQQRENQRKPQRRLQKAKYSAKYRKNNQDYIQEYSTEYVTRPHVIEMRRQANQRYNENRGPRSSTEHSRAINRAWWQERRQNPKWNLHFRISSRVRSTLKNGLKEGRTWRSLLKFSVEELIQHLERQFKPGMSWANMREWHIDHIIPVASFNFNSPEDEDFKKCWALPNLQPLWAKENIVKGNKIPIELGGRISVRH